MTVTLHRGDLPAGLSFGNAVAIDTETMGLKPGREVGEAYRFLLDLRLDEGVIGEDEAERRLREWWAARA